MRATQAKAASRTPTFDEEELDGLATSLAAQFALLYDARPADAHVASVGNTLVFSFQGGLTSVDERMVEAGHLDRLRRFRQQFLGAIGDRLSALVRAATGTEVVSFLGDFHPESRTTRAVFVLDPSSRGDREARQALLNWSVQVRRNARILREEHLANRHAHHELKRELVELCAAIARTRSRGEKRQKRSDDR
jgi:uncharacterized protein YbcI